MKPVNSARQPVIFLPVHGIPEAPHAWQALSKRAAGKQRPDFVLMVNSQWTTEVPTLAISHEPTTVPANFVGEGPILPLIARRLKSQGMPCQVASEYRKAPETQALLSKLYPDADIPLIQLSMKSNTTAAEQLMLGQALAWLRDEQVLILGCGFYGSDQPGQGVDDSHRSRKSFLFDQWLNQIVTQDIVTLSMRKTLLARWESAPHALFCHPNVNSLLPLHLCCGAADFGVASLLYDQQWSALQLSAFWWK